MGFFENPGVEALLVLNEHLAGYLLFGLLEIDLLLLDDQLQIKYLVLVLFGEGGRGDGFDRLFL